MAPRNTSNYAFRYRKMIDKELFGIKRVGGPCDRHWHVLWLFCYYADRFLQPVCNLRRKYLEVKARLAPDTEAVAGTATRMLAVIVCTAVVQTVRAREYVAVRRSSATVVLSERYVAGALGMVGNTAALPPT